MADGHEKLHSSYLFERHVLYKISGIIVRYPMERDPSIPTTGVSRPESSSLEQRRLHQFEWMRPKEGKPTFFYAIHIVADTYIVYDLSKKTSDFIHGDKSGGKIQPTSARNVCPESLFLRKRIEFLLNKIPASQF